MYNQDMKYRPYIILIATVLLLIAGVIFFAQKAKPEPELAVQNMNIGALEINKLYCYQYTSASSGDIEEINFTIDADGIVRGTHVISPAAFADSSAKILGMTNGIFLNVVASLEKEGVIFEEQRVYKVENDRLYVGYQRVDVPRYKNSQGVSMYEEVNQLFFDTDEFFLTKMNCPRDQKIVL